VVKKPYILYIEDEPPMHELVRETLKFSGDDYDVVGVTSGEQGLAMMREQKPDLLLLDLMIPDFNGWELYREMKTDEQLADVPVIVITSRVSTSGRRIVPELPPVDDYITKPFSIQRLIRSVQSSL
jgi:DNA-binding response OmpR family regulator